MRLIQWRRWRWRDEQKRLFTLLEGVCACDERQVVFFIPEKRDWNIIIHLVIKVSHIFRHNRKYTITNCNARIYRVPRSVLAKNHNERIIFRLIFFLLTLK